MYNHTMIAAILSPCKRRETSPGMLLRSADRTLESHFVLNVDRPSRQDYRVSHQATGAGIHYDKTFDAGYCAALWQKIERPLLQSILHPLGGRERTSLDFACGTGRIARVTAMFFGAVVGIDVSEAMLMCASVPENVTLYCIDITKVSLAATFDVVTAFWFFPNAEDSLRREALRAIYRRLREGGVLVCNIHLNATSPMGLASRVLNWAYPKIPRNTLTLDQFSTVLKQERFEIVDTKSYGYLPRPGPLFPRLCQLLVEPFEKACKALKVPGWLAENFIIVSRKRSTPEKGILR
jgi:SAM-dependent methyltransferase